MAVSTDSPRYVGGILPAHAVTITDDSGNVVNLTGATLTSKMVNQLTGAVNVCGGVWTITNAAAGQATYSWQTADLAVPGVWDFYTTATYGTSPQEFEPETIVILAHP